MVEIFPQGYPEYQHILNQPNQSSKNKYSEFPNKLFTHLNFILGDLDTIKRLIEQGVNINATNKDHWTILHFSAFFGNFANIIWKKWTNQINRNELNWIGIQGDWMSSNTSFKMMKQILTQKILLDTRHCIYLLWRVICMITIVQKNNTQLMKTIELDFRETRCCEIPRCKGSRCWN